MQNNFNQSNAEYIDDINFSNACMEPSEVDYVIYHGGCRDGFCAAWIINKYLDTLVNKPQVAYHSGFHGQEPPDVTGKDVIIVDFAYDIKTMGKIYNDARRVTWLDHHKTAEPIHIGWGEDTPTHNHVFDIKRSGAGLAWDYYFPNEPRPWLVDYVEDRDLWAKKLDSSDIVNAYIACLEFDFSTWDFANDAGLDYARRAGYVAEMKTKQYVTEACKNAYLCNIENPTPMTDEDITKYTLSGEIYGWKDIPVVNICQVDCSEVLHELCKQYPNSQFSMYWFRRPDGMTQYGLRSIGDFDVSEVAKLFGGGGHKNAAGFQQFGLLEDLQ